MLKPVVLHVTSRL